MEIPTYDFGTIVKKLLSAGEAKEHSNGVSGKFCAKKHAYLLEPEETRMFLKMLHESMGESENPNCQETHAWNIDFVNLQ